LQRDRLAELFYRESGEHGQRDTRPDARNLDEFSKGSPFPFGGKAIEQMGIFSDYQMGEQSDRLAHRRESIEAAHGQIDLVTQACGLHNNSGRGFGKEGAGE